MKNKTTAILLALFLGGLGIHKFYLNRPRHGVLYIAFCWTFIPSVLACIDIVRYLLKSNEEFSSIYS